jgi:hypothetical protein
MRKTGTCYRPAEEKKETPKQVTPEVEEPIKTKEPAPAVTPEEKKPTPPVTPTFKTTTNVKTEPAKTVKQPVVIITAKKTLHPKYHFTYCCLLSYCCCRCMGCFNLSFN